MTPIERLLQKTTKAVEQLFGVLCRRPAEVAPAVSQSGSEFFLDVVVTTSQEDEDVLRNAGADNALATLARVIGDQSDLEVTVSIQIA